MYEKENRTIVTQDIQIRNIFENFFFPEYIKYLDQLNNKLDAIVEYLELFKTHIIIDTVARIANDKAIVVLSSLTER